jgi:hypothetical protein
VTLRCIDAADFDHEGKLVSYILMADRLSVIDQLH